MKSELSTTKLSAYAFCVPRYAGSGRPRCVRPVRVQRGGQVDTDSLCGRVTPIEHGGQGGNDEPQPVTQALLTDERFTCRECAYRMGVAQ